MKTEGSFHIELKNEHKASAVLAGIALVLFGVLLLLDALGVAAPVLCRLSPWHILLALAVIVILLREYIVKKRFKWTFILLGLLFIAVEPAVAALTNAESCDILSNWTVMLIALVMTAGLFLILPRQGFEKKIADKVGKAASHSKFTKKTLYIDASVLTEETVKDILGNVDIYFDNIEAYPGGGTLRVSDIVGNVTVYVPASWQFHATSSDHIGNLSVPDERTAEPDGKELSVQVSDIVGNVDILWA